MAKKIDKQRRKELIEQYKEIKTYMRTRGQVPCPLFSPMFDALRPTESAKIECGKKHFEALGTEVGFEDIDSFEEFIEEKVVVK